MQANNTECQAASGEGSREASKPEQASNQPRTFRHQGSANSKARRDKTDLWVDGGEQPAEDERVLPCAAHQPVELVVHVQLCRYQHT